MYALLNTSLAEPRAGCGCFVSLPILTRNGDKAAGLQGDAPGAYRRLRTSGPGFPLVPLEELVEPQIVHATRDRGGDTVEHQSFQSLPMGSLRNNNQISQSS